MIHGILKENKDIVKDIKDRTKGKFYITYGNKNTNILFENLEDFANMKKHLIDVDQDCDITVKSLQKKEAHLTYTKIEWNRHRTNRKAIQCHHCRKNRVMLPVLLFYPQLF